MSPAPPNPKRLARELALQTLFQTEFTASVPYQDFLGLFESSVDSEALDYANELVRGVKARGSEIDALIQAASVRWKIERMAIVDRNLLRIAVFEMKHLPSPLKPSIVINEAVDIAKKFGTNESSSFVNGILDQIRKDSGWE